MLSTACVPAIRIDPLGGGQLQTPELVEASGLAPSRLDPERLWAINDAGNGALLYAVDPTGKSLARLPVRGANNTDWEDLASVVLDGDPYLLIADVGDNEALRDHVTLYWIREPEDLTVAELSVARRQPFFYPDGPRDCESVAIDVPGERIILVSKRDIPARVYELPLRFTDGGPLTAKYLGSLDQVPQPSPTQVKEARRTDNYFWQPTGLDISPDGRLALVLTYPAVYIFRRARGGSALGVLSERIGHQPITMPEAEAVSFGTAGREFFVTGEKRHAPIVRFEVR